MEGMLPALLAWLPGSINRWAGRFARMTAGEYLRRRFRDPRLRALLVSHWGDYGLPPGQSSLAVHALITTHDLDGAWYPEGASGGIARGAGAVIRAADGELLPGHEVTRILSGPAQ